MQKMSGCYTTGLYLTGAYPAPLQDLKAVIPESNVIASRRIALHPPTLALAVLDSFRHHRHCLFSKKQFNKRKTF
jgi:hypothetical protein